MDMIPRNDYGKRCQFDAYCKLVLYNCVGAIFIPDVFPLPAPQVSVNTRKGVVVNYAPGQLAV